MDNICIMGIEVKIIYKKMKDHGRFNGDDNTIYISNKLKGKMLEDTILHESVHALLFYSGLNNFLSEDLEEALSRLIEYNYIELVRKVKNLTKKGD